MKTVFFLLLFLALCLDRCVGEKLPTVIWHGMGDTYDADGISQLVAQLQDRFGASHKVWVIRMDESSDRDRRASMLGHVESQIQEAHSQIAAQPEFANGYDAIGFSQGGVFMRALAQSYPDPPMRTLVTMGSPHMGVDALPPCTPPSFLCTIVHSILRAGVWSSSAQSSVVPAQYFRDQKSIDVYLRKSGWLQKVNNERWGDEQVGGSDSYLDNDPDGADESPRNASFAQNLAKLHSLVLFHFTDENVVYPASSPNFTLTDPDTKESIPYSKLPLYKHDYVGIRTLDERGALHFDKCSGGHMQIDAECWDRVMKWLL